MELSYPLLHSLSLAPPHQDRADWVRRIVGATLVFYLMPLILVVLTIGAVGVLAGKGWRVLRSRG